MRSSASVLVVTAFELLQPLNMNQPSIINFLCWKTPRPAEALDRLWMKTEKRSGFYNIEVAIKHRHPFNTLNVFSFDAEIIT